MYGLPGTIEATQHGYLLKTWGQQGRTERCAVLLPEGSKPIASASVRDVPKQPKRLWADTPIQFVAGNGRGVAFDVTFRRDAAPDELCVWEVKPGSLADGTAAGWAAGFKEGKTLRFPLFVDAAGVSLPMWDADADKLGLGPLADFCGAYVENAFCRNARDVDRSHARGECQVSQGRSGGKRAGNRFASAARDRQGQERQLVGSDQFSPAVHVCNGCRAVFRRAHVPGAAVCQAIARASRLQPGSTASRWTFASISIPATAGYLVSTPI